jgi:hypothetical protein
VLEGAYALVRSTKILKALVLTTAEPLRNRK